MIELTDQRVQLLLKNTTSNTWLLPRFDLISSFFSHDAHALSELYSRYSRGKRKRIRITQFKNRCTRHVRTDIGIPLKSRVPVNRQNALKTPESVWKRFIKRGMISFPLEKEWRKFSKSARRLARMWRLIANPLGRLAPRREIAFSLVLGTDDFGALPRINWNRWNSNGESVISAIRVRQQISNFLAAGQLNYNRQTR